MATCKLCSRSGLFLSVNSFGLCGTCNSQLITETKLLLPEINRFMKKADTEANLKKRVECCDRAIVLAQRLIKYENLGISTIKPLPSLIVKTYAENKAKLLETISKTKPPKQMFLEYPLGIRMTLLMHYEHPSGDLEQNQKYYSEASKIENIIVDRNIKGQELEKQSKIDKAIALYESNIADFVDTPAPYDRLRVIYTKRKQYADAIRACEAFIEMCKRSSNAAIIELGNKELAEQLANEGKYPEFIEKLKSTLALPPSPPR